MEAEALFTRQGEIVSEIQRIGNNFSKDSTSRKTSEYLKIRLDSLARTSMGRVRSQQQAIGKPRKQVTKVLY